MKNYKRRSFAIADLHLNHDAMVTPNPDAGGERYRPFESVKEMNETLINNICKVVGFRDKLYLVGDVFFKPASSEPLLKMLREEVCENLILIMGNHDDIKKSTRYYVDYFSEILLWRIFPQYDFVLTHIPLHPMQMRDVNFNVHGHLHKVKMEESPGMKRYVNISAENIDYTPVDLEVIAYQLKCYKDLVKGNKEADKLSKHNLEVNNLAAGVRSNV